MRLKPWAVSHYVDLECAGHWVADVLKAGNIWATWQWRQAYRKALRECLHYARQLGLKDALVHTRVGSWSQQPMKRWACTVLLRRAKALRAWRRVVRTGGSAAYKVPPERF